jgi:hypothetical protein
MEAKNSLLYLSVHTRNETMINTDTNYYEVLRDKNT